MARVDTINNDCSLLSSLLSAMIIMLFNRKDSKYKLKVRMQEISAVQEYIDVDMDNGIYKRGDISRLLTDDEVKAVVGKLKRV